jgi:hypothetical protein
MKHRRKDGVLGGRPLFIPNFGSSLEASSTIFANSKFDGTPKYVYDK